VIAGISWWIANEMTRVKKNKVDVDDELALARLMGVVEE
jgi:hypothetical protein